LKFEPAFASAPFNLEKFRRNFHVEFTLDEEGKQEIKTNLLGDVETL